MHSALAFASSAATASYTLAPSRTFAFRQTPRACHLQSRRLFASLFSYSYESPVPPARPHPFLFSYTYKSLGGQPLWIHILTNPPGVWGCHCSSVLTTDQSQAASRFVSTACRLSCSLKKVNSFAIKQIQTLLWKHPGVGYVNIQAPRRATWTRRTHPIINAARLRCQVHG